MSFSERMKLVSEKQIQTEGIDTSLRHRLINQIENEFSDRQAKYVLDVMGHRTMPEADVFHVSLNRGGKNLVKLTALLEKMAWNNVYDVIEYGYVFLKVRCKDCTDDCNAVYDADSEEYYICEYKDDMDQYSIRFNSILEQEKSGYRIINGMFSPIVGEVEMACIEEATNTNFHSVNTHLKKALQFYSDRENPDYENSIKESISAVEAMCCIITGFTGVQATLGKTLKYLEDNGIVLHGALKAAFEKMYGYASDSDGIRHGGIDFKKAPSEDAKYMLISCSAFINYLIEKYAKITGAN